MHEHKPRVTRHDACCAALRRCPGDLVERRAHFQVAAQPVVPCHTDTLRPATRRGEGKEADGALTRLHRGGPPTWEGPLGACVSFSARQTQSIPPP